MYICIEGLKGSGKTTLLELASKYFTARRVAFGLMAPTRPVPLAHSLRERLGVLVPCLHRLDAWNEHLYARRAQYAASKAEWNKPLILGDRSIVTSYATRWRKWRSPEECIQRVNRLEPMMPVPDHVILLEVAPDVAWQRTLSRRRTYGQQDESLARLYEVREAYHQIAAFNIARLSNTQWHFLDANQPVETVFENWLHMMQHVAPALIQSLTI